MKRDNPTRCNHRLGLMMTYSGEPEACGHQRNEDSLPAGRTTESGLSVRLAVLLILPGSSCGRIFGVYGGLRISFYKNSQQCLNH